MRVVVKYLGRGCFNELARTSMQSLKLGIEALDHRPLGMSLSAYEEIHEKTIAGRLLSNDVGQSNYFGYSTPRLPINLPTFCAPARFLQHGPEASASKAITCVYLALGANSGAL